MQNPKEYIYCMHQRQRRKFHFNKRIPPKLVIPMGGSLVHEWRNRIKKNEKSSVLNQFSRKLWPAKITGLGSRSSSALCRADIIDLNLRSYLVFIAPKNGVLSLTLKMIIYSFVNLNTAANKQCNDDHTSLSLSVVCISFSLLGSTWESVNVSSVLTFPPQNKLHLLVKKTPAKGGITLENKLVSFHLKQVLWTVRNKRT